MPYAIFVLVLLFRAARHSAESIVRSGALKFLSSPILWLILPQRPTLRCGVAAPYYLGVATIALFVYRARAAWNIVGGIGGQMSLGHSVS